MIQRPLVLALVIAAFAAINAPLSSRAGSLIVSTGPTILLTNVLDITPGGNTFTLTTTSNSAKIFGDGMFRLTDTSGIINMNLTGFATGTAGEIAFTSYDLFVTLLGTGSFSLVLDGNISLFGGLVNQPFGFDTGVIPGPLNNQNFMDTKSTDASPIGFTNAPFTADLMVLWTGAVDDEMTVNIPQNSIDFAIIPEPGSALSVLFGSACLLVARCGRRR